MWRATAGHTMEAQQCQGSGGVVPASAGGGEEQMKSGGVRVMAMLESITMSRTAGGNGQIVGIRSIRD